MPQADAYIAEDPLEIILCTSIRNESQMRRLLLHELVHAYDFSNQRVDFSSCEGNYLT